MEREIYPTITILSVHSHRFALLYLNMDKALKNSAPGKVTYIWRIEQFQIDTVKFERTHFFSFCDVFAAFIVASGPYYVTYRTVIPCRL